MDVSTYTVAVRGHREKWRLPYGGRGGRGWEKTITRLFCQYERRLVIAVGFVVPVSRLQSSVQYLLHAARAAERFFYRTGSDDFRERFTRQVWRRFAQTAAGCAWKQNYSFPSLEQQQRHTRVYIIYIYIYWYTFTGKLVVGTYDANKETRWVGCQELRWIF